MHPCNLNALLLVIFRPLLFSTQPALQQFQLALLLLKELRRLYENTVTGCQKLLQSHIYANGMTMWHRISNANVALNVDQCIPSICLLENPHLLHHKPIRDRAVQVNRNQSDFRQLQMQLCDRTVFELGKQQRFELPVFFESGESKSTSLEPFPSSVQLLDGLLQNLRRHISQTRKFLFGVWQSVQLLHFAGEFQIRRQNVFLLDRASVYGTLPAIAPILYLSQRIVIGIATSFHPLKQGFLLSGVGIDAIAVVHGQHTSSTHYLLEVCYLVNACLIPI
ncbi:hypothetical protein CKA32_004922 [Geitlerinema sp. FC II]|nr:hypothetical protein CKA32_004922 [Geitlerinema sp. FC II]